MSVTTRKRRSFASKKHYGTNVVFNERETRRDETIHEWRETRWKKKCHTPKSRNAWTPKPVFWKSYAISKRNLPDDGGSFCFGCDDVVFFLFIFFADKLARTTMVGARAREREPYVNAPLYIVFTRRIDRCARWSARRVCLRAYATRSATECAPV